MKWLRVLLSSVFIFFCLALVLSANYYYNGFHKTYLPFHRNVDHVEISKLNFKASLLKKFAFENNYNQKIIFLIDLSLPSGKNRFFIYDLQKDSVIENALVAHGSGNSGFSLNAKFSNQCESGCSSLGKYKIGNKYNGRFGTAYKLYGLDSTNSNAFKRNIVLHSYNCVPSNETYPYPICNSRGCPMVSPEFMKDLQIILDTNKQPLLLWVFN